LVLIFLQKYHNQAFLCRGCRAFGIRLWSHSRVRTGRRIPKYCRFGISDFGNTV